MKNNSCEVSFYHLSKYHITKALPKLLEKVNQSGKNCLVVCNDEHEMKVLDDVIWTFASRSFVPHGTINDLKPEIQPILLSTTTDNLNKSEIIVMLTEKIPGNLNEFKRCLDLFYNENEKDANAEKRYSEYGALGCKLNYWIQNAEGNWEAR